MRLIPTSLSLTGKIRTPPNRPSHPPHLTLPALHPHPLTSRTVSHELDSLAPKGSAASHGPTSTVTAARLKPSHRISAVPAVTATYGSNRPTASVQYPLYAPRAPSVRPVCAPDALPPADHQLMRSPLFSTS